jgi:hypothetical protein
MQFRSTFRAAVAAFALGTAALGAASLTLMATPAEAAARPVVGKALQEAIRLAGAGNYNGAKAAVAQAEAMGGLTAGDREAINQVKSYIAQKSGAAGGKGGLIADYNAGRYNDVIAAGQRGGLDAQSMVLVAQAYYLSHNYTGCTRYIRNNFGGGAGENMLVMLQRCAYENQDNENQRYALEQLVQRTNKPEYWSQLLDTAQGTRGITDHGTLDVYRLKLMTGTIKKGDDYMLLAQLALQLGFAAESQTVLQKGIAAKALTMDNRLGRLVNMAKGQAGANAANFDRLSRTGNGDQLVKLGEDAWGQGRAADALRLIKAGIAKGVSDKADAQIRLGMALLASGQKADAARTFAAVDGPPKVKVVAHLWEIYARTH